MTLLKTVLILLACCDFVFSKRYCKDDSECDVIGDLTCQKSLCESWGICGCPRGQASRFVGSSLKFQCVTLKKIGESCSTDGTDGICGAEFAECADGKCGCKATYFSIWDGERCIKDPKSASSETCSSDDSIGDCTVGTCRSNDWWADLEDSPFDGVPKSCACAEGEQTIIPNDYAISEFVGRRTPTCQPIPIGGRCMRNADCTNVGGTGVICDNFVCSCTGTDKARSDNMACGTFKTQNQNCDNNIDCEYGLTCGDVCDIERYTNTAVQKTCVCAPGFTGESCTQVTEGGSCSGDRGCKSIGYDALCLDGVCHSGATLTSISVRNIFLVVLSLLMLSKVFE